MKKFFVFAATLAAVLFTVSCEKEDVIATTNTAMGNEIQVSAIIAGDVATKASDVYVAEAGTGKNLTAFDLAVFRGDANLISTTCKKVSEKWQFGTGNDKYYWSKGAKYKFFATTDANSAISGTTITKNGISIANYVVTADPNLLTEDASGSTNQPDPCIAIKEVDATSATPADGKVDLVFNHILARVGVAVKYSSKSTEMIAGVKVLGYQFDDVRVKGSISKYATETKTTSGAGNVITWSDVASGEKGDVRDNRYTTATAPGAYQSTSDFKGIKSGTDMTWCNVVPGAVATALTVKVAFYDNKNNLIGVRYLRTTDFGTGATTKYESGKQYKYSVTIEGNGGNGGVTDPDTNPTTPDEFIDNFQIKLNSITVSPWKDETGGTASFTNA